MKRLLLFLLAFAIIISVSACTSKTVEKEAEKTEAVKHVEKLIDEIGTVSINSKELIETAEKEFGYLTPDEQASVSNRTVLLRAKDEYQEAFNAYFMSEWTYVYRATRDDTDVDYDANRNPMPPKYNKGDELEQKLTMLPNGTFEILVKNRKTDNEWYIAGGTLGGQHTSWSIDGSMLTLEITYDDYIGAPAGSTTIYLIDTVNNTLTDKNNSDKVFTRN